MLNFVAVTVFTAAAEIAASALILTIGAYWHRIWLALQGVPQVHLAFPPRPTPARQTPRSLPPSDSLFLTPASTRPAPGQKVRSV